MPRADCQTLINRACGEVWTYTSDPANLAVWQADVKEVFLRGDGVPCVGASWTEVRESPLAGQPVDYTWQIVAWNPPHIASFEVVAGPMFIKVELTFSPDGERTVVRCAVETEARGLLKPALGLIPGSLERMVARDLEELKRLLEN